MTNELKERLVRNLRARWNKQSKKRAKKATRAKKKNVAAPALVGALKYKPACEYLGGIHPATLRRAVERGLIRPNKMFRHVLFPIKELDRLIEEGMIE